MLRPIAALPDGVLAFEATGEIQASDDRDETTDRRPLIPRFIERRVAGVDAFLPDAGAAMRAWWRSLGRR